MQKVTPEVARLPIQSEEKEGGFKALPSMELPNKPQEALCCPQNLCYPQFLCPQMLGHHLSLQTLVKLI